MVKNIIFTKKKPKGVFDSDLIRALETETCFKLIRGDN
jgi:hypothetical protein